MSNPSRQPTTEGHALRVIVLTPQFTQAYENVYAQLDASHGLVHIYSSATQVHHLSVPLQSCIVEWQDASVLSPVPYSPSFGPGAFERMGEQMNGMMEEMQRAFDSR